MGMKAKSFILLLYGSILMRSASTFRMSTIRSRSRSFFCSKGILFESFSSYSGTLDALEAEKDEAVAEEDYLRAAKLKSQIDAIKQQQQCISSGLMLHVERAIPLHNGDVRFPPMDEVPCFLWGVPRLKKLVKPPDADILWQWHEELGYLDADPSWAELWPSASSLAAVLVDRQEIVRNQSVADLGCGLGVAGLTAAALGASSVLLMDKEPYALHCAMSTAALNQLSEYVEATIVDWSANETQDPHRSSATIALASDVLYDLDAVRGLVDLVCIVLKQPGGRLWVTDPELERVRGLRETFLKALEDRGATTSVTALPIAPVYSSNYSERGNPERTVLIEALWHS